MYYFNKYIIEKINSFGRCKDVEKKKSLFDEYDKEEGYNLEEEITYIDIANNLRENINYFVRYSINNMNNSYKDTVTTDMLQLLNYIKFSMERDEEEKEDED